MEGSIVSVLNGFLPRGLVCNKVKNSSNPFRIIFCSRIGNYLDALEGACGHHLKDLRGIRGKHRIRFSVHIYLEGGTSVYGNIVLGIDGYHRDLAEHVQHGHRLAVDVVLHLICHLVDLHLDKGLQGGYSG